MHDKKIPIKIQFSPPSIEEKKAPETLKGKNTINKLNNINFIKNFSL